MLMFNDWGAAGGLQGWGTRIESSKQSQHPKNWWWWISIVKGGHKLGAIRSKASSKKEGIEKEMWVGQQYWQPLSLTQPADVSLNFPHSEWP